MSSLLDLLSVPESYTANKGHSSIHYVLALLMATAVKLRSNLFPRIKKLYVIGEVRCNQQGKKNADHVPHVAVESFPLLLISPLDLIVIFPKIKLSVVDANVLLVVR